MPLCDPSILERDSAKELNATVSFYKSLPLTEPPEEAEDHFTFIVGMLLLLVIAMTCTFFMNKMTKPK